MKHDALLKVQHFQLQSFHFEDSNMVPVKFVISDGPQLGDIHKDDIPKLLSGQIDDGYCVSKQHLFLVF